MPRSIPTLTATLALFLSAITHAAPPATTTAPASSYAQPGALPVATLLADWKDQARDRVIPVKIYYPKVDAPPATPYPVIVFSHGLGGSRDGYRYLGQHWASRGYVSVHLTHPGSDTSVLLHADGRIFDAMRRAAADPQNILNRPKDISFAIDQLIEANKSDPTLKGRLDLDRIGVAGHSFGAYTTLAAAGQTFSTPTDRKLSLGDPRVKAAIAMSAPTGPRNDKVLDESYATIAIPCFHMTGTKDTSPLFLTSDPADRRIPFDHMSSADNYLLTFKDGDHMIFSGRLAASRPTDTHFQKLILSASTAFWDAYLKSDPAAKTFLQKTGFSEELGQDGTFETKLKTTPQSPTTRAVRP